MIKTITIGQKERSTNKLLATADHAELILEINKDQWAKVRKKIQDRNHISLNPNMTVIISILIQSFLLMIRLHSHISKLTQLICRITQVK